MVIICCGEEMLIAGRWYHCRKCSKRLVEFPLDKDREVIADLVIEYVQEFEPRWKDFKAIFHELWRAGYYEDYTPELPEEWGK